MDKPDPTSTVKQIPQERRQEPPKDGQTIDGDGGRTPIAAGSDDEQSHYHEFAGSPSPEVQLRSREEVRRESFADRVKDALAEVTALKEEAEARRTRREEIAVPPGVTRKQKRVPRSPTTPRTPLSRYYCHKCLRVELKKEERQKVQLVRRRAVLPRMPTSA